MRDLGLKVRDALGSRRSRNRVAPRSDDPPVVVITGVAGLIGSVLASELRRDYAIRGIDRKRGDDVDRVVDLRRLPSIEPAFAGSTAVVHLGAVTAVDASWPSVLEHNVEGTVNVLEAARRSGVDRVILASSNHVVGGYEGEEPFRSIVAGRYEGLDPDGIPRLGVDVPIRPDGPYGISKAFAEAAGRYYADDHEISVICLRIGTVNRADRPTQPRHFATWLSHRDLVELVRSSLAAPSSVRFAIVYGVSANRWRFWDVEGAQTAVGFVPCDDAEAWRGQVA